MADNGTSSASNKPRQINFSPLELTSVMAMLYPYFIMLYFFFSACFNYKISGILFLTGVMFLWLIGYGISTILGKGLSNATELGYINSCNIFAGLAPYQSDIPQFTTALCFFCLVVVIMPMTSIVQSTPIVNVVLLGVMALFTCAHIWWLVSRVPKCTTWTGVLTGSILGIIVGVLYFCLLFGAFKDSRHQVLFFNEILSDNVVCNKPTKTLFKCSVSKGGNLIGGTV